MTLKKEVLDPQGKVVQNTLVNMGMNNLKNIRQGKTLAKVAGTAAGIGAMFIPGFGAVALGSKALKITRITSNSSLIGSIVTFRYLITRITF